MLRIGSKRRRTRQEILDEKEESRKKELPIQGKLEEFEMLKAKVQDYDRLAKAVEQAEEMRDSLLQSGHLVKAEDGSLVPIKIDK